MTNKVTVLDKNWLHVTFIKSGNIKYARCSSYPNANMSANTEYHIGTLPEEFRPTYDISYVNVINPNGTIANLLIKKLVLFRLKPTPTQFQLL